MNRTQSLLQRNFCHNWGAEAGSGNLTIYFGSINCNMRMSDEVIPKVPISSNHEFFYTH